MKLFIYEHITSGALSTQPLPDSLANEGNAMLAAVLHDCAALDYLTLSTLRDARLATIDLFDREARHQCHRVSTSLEYAQSYQQCLNDCDAILIIAPETDDILAGLTQGALEQGKSILGCQPNAIRVASNKYDCYQQLHNCHIPAVKTILATQWPNHVFTNLAGYVLKPLNGAGCLDTYHFKTKAALEQFLTTYDVTALNNAIIQPYLDGISASLSLLANNNEIEVLAINQQHITQSGTQLKLAACTINDLDSIPFTIEQAQQLATQIHSAIPGLWGHIGIDIILTQDTAFVVDINPRLTSSYIALHESLNLNPMARLLNMIKQRFTELPPITQRQTVVLTL